jgi:hypothetical protein
MNNPKPTPSEEEPVANFENSLGRILSAMPVPVSFILTTTTSSSLSVFVLALYYEYRTTMFRTISLLILTNLVIEIQVKQIKLLHNP